jgi:hypothetical protein
MYNQHTRERATTRHRSLVERGGEKAFLRDKGLARKKRKEKKKTKCQEKPTFTNLKKGIRALRPSSKATRLFLTK